MTDVQTYTEGIPLEIIPWYTDPPSIARVLRWLILIDQIPPDIPSFIENAATWESAYRLMRAAEGNRDA